ncbi:MAG: cell division protein FtsQ/DivIB [Fusobacteriaceae bacterium]|nr:cell division protein FtsQ/DivIB [Fusobacteriaceae bacterium]
MLRIFFRISLLLALSYLFYYIPGRFFKLPLFQVKTPKIEYTNEKGAEGNRKISQNELTEMGEITYNSNIWEIDYPSIEKLLRGDIRIKDAKVYPSAPDEVTFLITEREPFSYIRQDNRIFLLDEEGILFGFLDEKEKKDLPLFVIGDEDPEKDDKIKRFIEIIKNMDENLLKEISQVYETDKHCVNLILVDGTLIRTDKDVGKSKYRIAGNLYYNLKKERKRIEYMDLRFDHFIVKENEKDIVKEEEKATVEQ